MADLKAELLRRRTERRNARSASWLGIIAKLLLLAFIVLLIRFMGKPSDSKFKSILKSNAQKNIENTGF